VFLEVKLVLATAAWLATIVCCGGRVAPPGGGAEGGVADGGQTDGAPADAGPIDGASSDAWVGPPCSDPSGWCFASPLPDGATIRDVAAAGPDDVWAVGDQQKAGVVHHWDGTTWSVVPVTCAPLYAVDASSANDVWAVGQAGTVVHWDGSTLSATTIPSTPQALLGVWAGGATNVWVVGTAGMVARWDGSTWSKSTLGFADLDQVWGTSASDLWAVGAGVVEHWDGSTWTAVAKPFTTNFPISDVWGASANDVWAVSMTEGFMHWDGTQWSAAAAPATGFSGLWGSASDDVWARGTSGFAHFDGTSWKTVGPQGIGPPTLSRLTGTSASDVWAGAGSPVVERFDGSAWAPQNAASGGRLVAIWGSSPSDVWTVGGDTVARWDGAWTSTTFDPSRLSGISGTSASDVWVVGDVPSTGRREILHWDGSTWSLAYQSAQSSGFLTGVFAIAPNDAWAVGNGSSGIVLHWNGATWAPQTGMPPTPYDAVWAASANDVWIGGNGLVAHWDGSSWTSRPTPNPAGFVTGIWGSSATDVWVAAADGLGGDVMHFDGTSWTSPAPLPGSFTPAAVTGRGPKDVYVAATGMNPAILHWDGATWQVEQSPLVQSSSSNPVGLYGAWALPNADVWLAGDEGSVLYHSGP
jgi:hypothetical protein